jgi:hypothetical protein
LNDPHSDSSRFDSEPNESIWCEIRLNEVAHVIRDYEQWKEDPWYHEVNWTTVCEVFSRALQETTANGASADLLTKLDELGPSLSPTDFEGLIALWREPITVTPVQLTNGGHRMTAMLEQGVATVPGMFHRDDIGESVEADRVYPLAPSSNT